MTIAAVSGVSKQYNNQPVGLVSNVVKGAIGGAVGAGAAAAALKFDHGEIGAIAAGGAAVGIVGGAVGAGAEYFGMSHKHASWLGLATGAGAGALALKQFGAFEGESALIGKPLIGCAVAAAVGGAIMFGVFNHGKSKD